MHGRALYGAGLVRGDFRSTTLLLLSTVRILVYLVDRFVIRIGFYSMIIGESTDSTIDRALRTMIQ